MSWLIGIIGKSKDRYVENIASIVGDKYAINNDFATIFTAGSSKALIVEQLARPNLQIIVNGVGLRFDGLNYEFMSGKEWIDCALSDDFSNVNGHYVFTKINNNTLTIRTDTYGLRDIYYTCLENDSYLISTRLDWILSMKSAEIDYAKVGARWLLSNAINDDLPYKDIHKINKGKGLEFKDFELSILQSHNNIENTEHSFETTLKKILNIDLPPYLKKSFLLSGGLDSRMLLSLFSHESLKETHFYTFGDASNMDVQIAKMIAKDLGLNHSVLNTAIADPEEFLAEFMNYSVLTFANNPLTSFANSNNLNNLAPNSFVLDGGFGEIWRNGFARKLYYFGKKAVEKKQSKNIMKFISYGRGSFLSRELLYEFNRGCLSDIDEYLESNPYVRHTSYRNYINNFCLSNRLPNYYAPEQSYTDAKIVSLMPFAQQNLLQKLNFQTTSSSGFKKILSKNNKKLTEYPLAKNGSSLSFRFSTVHSLLEKYAHRLKKSQHIEDYSDLDCLRGSVLDLLSSDEVMQNPLYNISKIRTLREFVYNTKNNIFINRDLDWFIAFHYSLYNKYRGNKN